MAGNVAEKDTIFQGRFYPMGAELPEEQKDLSKPSTARLGGGFAAQVKSTTEERAEAEPKPEATEKDTKGRKK